MILIAHAQIELCAPASEVFDYVGDLLHFPEWFPGVQDIRARQPDTPPGIGKQYLETLSIPLRGQRQVSIRVMEWQPGRMMVSHGRLAPISPRMKISVAPAGNHNCTLHWSMHSRNRSPIFRWTLLPLARRVMRPRADQAMQRLGTRFGMPT